MTSTIDPETFKSRLSEKLATISDKPKCVTGPGRSGAIASVYASHMLGIPFIPYGQSVPEHLKPVLVVDTASLTGKTMRKAVKRYETDLGVVAFQEPPRVRFWYERGVE